MSNAATGSGNCPICGTFVACSGVSTATILVGTCPVDGTTVMCGNVPQSTYFGPPGVTPLVPNTAPIDDPGDIGVADNEPNQPEPIESPIVATTTDTLLNPQTDG